MGQLIRFPTEIRKCPVGKLAFHPKYGVCNVIGANGFIGDRLVAEALLNNVRVIALARKRDPTTVPDCER